MRPHSNSGDLRPPPRKTARALIDSGLSVVVIEHGEKTPRASGWPTRSAAPEEFQAGDNIGIVCGPISNLNKPGELALVCVDVDAPEALAEVGQMLPWTAMIEGRASKPRSHWWYAVDLSEVPKAHHSPAPLTAPAMVEAFGQPGPRSRSYRTPDRREILAFKGTGAQAVVAPSLHGSGEVRTWHKGERGLPRLVDYDELVTAVRKLAEACGWQPRREPTWTPTGRVRGPITSRRVSRHLAFRISRYLEECDPAVSGRNGHSTTFSVCCRLVWGFGLPGKVAFEFLERYWNWRCSPPWSRAELVYKINQAIACGDDGRPRGYMLRR